MKARKRAGTVGKVLGCALLLVIALFPIYWLVAMAIRPTSEMQGHISLIPQSLTIEHFISLFVSKGFGQAAINSLQTTLSSLVLSLIVGVCAAYILARRRFRFGLKRPMTYWVLLVRVLPPVAFTIPLYTMFSKIGLLNTKIPVTLACVLINVPLIIWFLISFFQDLPEEVEEDETPDYPVHVFLSREGYCKKITPASLRMSSEQKYKEGDGLLQTFETTNNAEIMFFTDHCQVYKTRLSEFEDTKASVLGDYLPAKLAMDPGENVIFAVLPGEDYTGALLFFFENGKAARVEIKSYQTSSNRRKLTSAYSDKSPLRCIRRIDTDCELAVYSTEPRVLIFHTALLAPKTTRTTQGVAVMTLKPKYRLDTVKALEETAITNQSRYRVRAIPAAGALLREADSEERQIGLLE